MCAHVIDIVKYLDFVSFSAPERSLSVVLADNFCVAPEA